MALAACDVGATEPLSDIPEADRAYWRRLFPNPPDMGQLLRHAERYGSDGVYETAEQAGYPLPELLQLDKELTRIDTERRKRFGKVPSRKRPSSGQAAEAVLYLTAEGVATQRIANQLGVTVRRVEQIRQRAREGATESATRPKKSAPPMSVLGEADSVGSERAA